MKSYETEPGVNAQTILRSGDLESARIPYSDHRRTIRANQARDPTLRQRRPLYGVAALLGVLSFAFGQPVLLLAGLLLLVLAFVPEVWYRWGMRALAVERHPLVNRAEFGETVEVVVTIENRKPLPLPWLEIDDEFAENLPVLGASIHPSASDERMVLRQTVAIWAYQRLRRRFSVRATTRGVFPFGPMTMRVTDPFGILEREERVRNADYLLVHPLVAPLERFGLPPNAPFGEHKSTFRLLEDPLRIAGVRDYAQGDEPRRIHWKATARTGALQSKVYEPATRHSLIILLDVRTLSNQLMGYDPKLMELAVTAAASVATWASDQRYAVGIHSNGTQTLTDGTTGAPGGAEAGDTYPAQLAHAARNLRLRVPISTGADQLTSILDGLARVLPYYALPMDQLIASEMAHLPFAATVIYIGTDAVLDVPLIVALRQLKSRGHPITLLLTTSRSDAAQDEVMPQFAGLPSHTIGDRSRWDALVDDVLGADAIRRNVSLRSLRVAHTSGGARRSARVQPSPQVADDSQLVTTLDGRSDATAARAGDAPANTPRRPRPLVVE